LINSKKINFWSSENKIKLKPKLKPKSKLKPKPKLQNPVLYETYRNPKKKFKQEDKRKTGIL
jgi:hypothetical protein